MNNWCICWFSCIFLLGILIFEGLTAQSLYKLFGVKGLIQSVLISQILECMVWQGTFNFLMLVHVKNRKSFLWKYFTSTSQ
jgi:hypothetical protein